MRRLQQPVRGSIKQPPRKKATTSRWVDTVEYESVRTFVAAAEYGQFQSAADELGITPQAVSKRVAALEHRLGAVLFSRSTHGVRLTREGHALLPHARELLRISERAERSVRLGNRALRVDVTHHRIAPSVVLQDFHATDPSLDIDVVSLPDNNLAGALTAVQTGSVDASFRAVTMPADQLPHGVRAERAIDHELELLVGPNHPLAGAASITPNRLAGQIIRIPGIVPDTEWARFYDDFAAAFGVTIDSRGPHFGDEALLGQLSENPEWATVVGKRDRYFWPAGYGLRRIPLREPTPVYPHSLIWLAANPHPGLAALRRYLKTVHASRSQEPDVWLPAWAHRHPVNTRAGAP